MELGVDIIGNPTPSVEATFTINGAFHRVNDELFGMTLNTYIRNYAQLPGTKWTCQEGGCGTCIVAITDTEIHTKQQRTYSVNSCLMPVFSCHGKAITTVEGIGGRNKGYDIVQKRLSEYNGTQCGYCSPGMVMNMYSLLKSGNVTMREVEDSFGGNLCRCTGYRPILDAFKSLASDASEELRKAVEDIEDLEEFNNCTKTSQKCLKIQKKNSGDFYLTECNKCVSGIEMINGAQFSPLHSQSGSIQWFKASKIDDIFNIFNTIGDKPYKLVAGNTSKGVYPQAVTVKVFIDVQDVHDLKFCSVDSTLKVGGNVTLTELIACIRKTDNPRYSYLTSVAKHIQLIGSVPIRNMGTIAGNLSIKHKYSKFPSDIFLLIETVGATLEIAKHDDVLNMSPREFLDTDMNHKLIKAVSFPPLGEEWHLKTYKIARRAQNTSLYVNAGFLFKLNKENNGEVLERPTIVYGGISPAFIHAYKTEDFLLGKMLFQQDIFKKAIGILKTEIVPNYVLPDSTPIFRKELALALFYKFVLSLKPPRAPTRILSGGDDLQRNLSSGKQSFEVDKSLFPLNEPVQMLEGLAQCAGEAEYLSDVPLIPGEVYAALVLTTVAQGFIDNVDPTPALEVPGVIKFIGANDIPGENNFMPTELVSIKEPEEVFCSRHIKYAGQAVGLIIAKTQHVAILGAKKVKVTCIGVNEPKLNMREVINSGDGSRIRVMINSNTSVQNKCEIEEEPSITCKGSFDMGSQFHFSMETLSAFCVPHHDEMDIYSSSEWMALTQVAVSRALKIPENKINIKVRRIGGSFGCKITRATFVATACAIAADILSKPVRLVLPLHTNMRAIGKRADFSVDYEVKVSKAGKILDLKADLFENVGCSWNDSTIGLAVEAFPNCYENNNWKITGSCVRLDMSSTTFCRASGSAQAISSMEYIMEHIARTLGKDQTEVRKINISEDDKFLTNMIESFKIATDYNIRKHSTDIFNKDNLWQKKGISLIPMKYPIVYKGQYSALVSIFTYDGTVAVTLSGIENGQGLNTKVAQIVAHTLGIPLESVSLKLSTTLTTPNASSTGFCFSSELCVYAAMVCCKELLRRMEPAKKDLKNPTWLEWIQAAERQNINLCTSHRYPYKDELNNYYVYGITISEVALDLLTGEYQIIRVDLLEDVGTSISPKIDIGQIEGAFVMGLGYWLMECPIYNPKTGELLTDRTWNYTIPGFKDIPIDFRIYFRKNAPNQFGVAQSKATEEPPLCMSCSLFFALKYAIDSARQEAGEAKNWFPMNPPATIENVFLASLTNSASFYIE